MLRIIIDVLIAVGAFFAIAGTLGVLKMPDTFSRMQASTCITTMGVIGVGLGSLLYAIFIMHSPATAVKVGVIVTLVLVTNPVGAHALARARIRRAYARKRKWRPTITGGILMSNLLVVLNVIVVSGLVISALVASTSEKLLSSVIALGTTGIFAAAEFLLLHAPDVAISEAAVGAALSPLIFIVTLKKIRGGDDK